MKHSIRDVYNREALHKSWQNIYRKYLYFSLSFSVDDVADYNPDLQYDPASQDPNHAQEVLKKFFKVEIPINNNTNKAALYFHFKNMKGKLDFHTFELE